MLKILLYWEAWGLDNKTGVAPDVSLNLLLLTYIIHMYTLFIGIIPFMWKRLRHTT